MGRPERKLDPDNDPLHRFAHELRRLREDAGKPSYRELAKRAHFSVTALAEAAGGTVVPSLAVTLAYVNACGGDQDEWRARWKVLTEELTPAKPEEDAARPYLGLMTFRTQDAPLFFGRDRMVRQLCERLTQARLLAVFGPSGVGKSSLLRAGLLAALSTGAIEGGRKWAVVFLTPGARPLRELASRLADVAADAADSVHDALTADPGAVAALIAGALAGAPPTARLLIVVDQFEEVFTHCADAGERARFVAVLLAAAGQRRARVVLGVRADFYARCAEHAGLAAALQDNQLLIGPMDEDDLRDVVRLPAERKGLKVEPELVKLVVDEARGRTGALSLVSHALLETWHRRRGTTLTVAGYRAAGGVQGAVAQTAERVYSALGPEERETARRIFLRLTLPGDGTEDARRRAPRGELAGGVEADVLDTLIGSRLVTADEESVTLAHEALIRGWPRLYAWLSEDRELSHAHQRLAEAAAEWDQHGRNEAFLYRGARLASWDARPTDRLNELEHAFLDAGRRHEAGDRAARRRRVQLALTGLVAAVLVVSTLATVAVVQAGLAREQRDIAVSRQLAAEAQGALPLDPERGLRLARRAYEHWPTVEAETALRQGLIDDRQLGVVSGLGRALGVAFSPVGDRVAVTAADGSVRIWRWAGDRLSGAPVAVLRGHDGEAWNPRFSHDGRHLVTAGLDGTVRVWDLDRGTRNVTLKGHKGPVWATDFSPDGRRVVSAGDDGTVRIWDAQGVDAPEVLRGHKGIVSAAAFSPDGRHVASGGVDHDIRIWDTKGGGPPKMLRGHEDQVKRLDFSPDGRLLASGALDKTALVWRVDGKVGPVPLRGHEGSVEGLAFSRDSRRLVTVSDDAAVRVYDPTGGGDPLVLRGHERVVWGAAFSPDGRRLVSAGEDGTVRTWDPIGLSEDPVILRGHAGEVWNAALFPDASKIVSGGNDGTVRVWDLTGRSSPKVLRGHAGYVTGVTAGPDGRTVASVGVDGTVRVWDVAGTTPPRVLRGHEGTSTAVAFSPDGRHLASVGSDGTLRVWPLTGSGSPRVVRASKQLVRYVAYSGDGRLMATVGLDETVRIWDAATLADPVVLRGHNGLVWAAAFSPDGRRVASSGSDGTVRIWDVTGRGEPRVLRGHQGSVWHLALSPDGQWVGAVGHDDTLRLWRIDAATAPLTVDGFAATTESIDFGPGGQVVTGHGDGTVRVWRCDACAPIGDVLAEAGRRLAPAH
ncbi:hypothetical protein JYK22_07665, partial [Nonomuraea sp. RK-328]|nr:hypothetical protein [Nonomuraea sp. RK-328]